MANFVIEAQARDDLGKGASRRLRRNASMVPGIIYGADKAPKSINILAKDLAKLLENESVFSQIIDVTIGKQKENVLIKALQRHPSKGFVLHIDLLRVRADHEITTNIPLHFINEDVAVGIKAGGGEISRIVNEVEVTCLPKNLPAFIEVDMANVELDDTVHLSDLKAPAGVTFVALSHENDVALATISLPKDQTIEEEAPEASAEGSESKTEE